MPLLASDNKALILAMDHNVVEGNSPGLEDPGRIIDMAAKAGIDGVMTSYGIIKRYRDRLVDRIPTIMRLDSGPSLFNQDWMAYTEYAQQFSVDDAVALGANAVVTNLFMGLPVELETFKITARVAADCYRTNIPYVVEALPCASERVPEPKSGSAMAAAGRLAFERGADYIKSYYTGSIESFKTVINNCPVPVLIAGGPKMETTEAMLIVVYEAMQAGASGVIFGRNIWQNPQPQRVINALNHIIHNNGSVSEALAELG